MPTGGNKQSRLRPEPWKFVDIACRKSRNPSSWVMNEDGTKRPPVFLILFLIILGIVLLGPSLAQPFAERMYYQKMRKKVYEVSLQRVEQAGGWQAIETASLAYAKQHDPANYFSGLFYVGEKRLTTNDLSATLDALKPLAIYFLHDAKGVPLLDIHMSGNNNTGTYPQPDYEVWVIYSNVPPNYVPTFSRDQAGRRSLIERKGDLIFEVR